MIKNLSKIRKNVHSAQKNKGDENMNFDEELIQVFSKHSIFLSPLQVELFSKYYHFLVEYNNVVNLTSITEQRDVIIKHFLDSVLAFNLIKENSSVIDIGCGAGFPSIPLKIVRPDIKLVLVDSVQKKLEFINQLISMLDLKNVSTIHSRAEDLAQKPDFREKFDFVVARAVARLNILCEYCLPFVKIGGKFIAYKAQDYLDEIEESNNAFKILGGKVEKIVHFEIENNQRFLVLIDKISSSPNKYPRGKNKPRISPL